MNDLLRKMKIILIAHYDFDMNPEGLKQAEEFLTQVEETVATDPYWKDGGHMGDCTKQSTPCERCWLENWESDAINALKYFNEKGN